MAHFTGLTQLQNHPHRAGFDIGSKNVFSAKCGELLPVFWDLGIPGCTYDINLQYFTRTRPVQTAAYTRIREYFDFYAVPLDLIWKSFDASVIQMGEVAPVQSKDILTALTVSGDLPYCSLSDLGLSCFFSSGSLSVPNLQSWQANNAHANIFGYVRGDVNYKLLHMLNYGNIIPNNMPTLGIGNSNYRWWNRQAPLASDSGIVYSQMYNFNMNVNVFPLAAYQKIYQDFFRWSQWENADPTSYNFDWYQGSGNLFGGTIDTSLPASSDYWKRDNLFSLRYCNWNKDLFMGILPNSQFGDIAVVDIEGGINIPARRVSLTSDNHVTSNVKVGAQFSAPNNVSITNSTGNLSIGENLSVGIPAASYSLESSFSILALRQAEALQKYREITQSVDTNYRDQIKAHFGVNVPASDSHMAQYIGGIARNLDISEVVNNNLQGDGEAVIYGKGVGTGTGSMRYTTGSKYCILMCIYHCMPVLDYDISGQHPQLLATSVDELPIPEFDNIGMEGVPLVQLFNSNLYKTNASIKVDSILGYNPRYYAWKSNIDRIHGAFTTTLQDWIAPVDDSFLYSTFGIPSSGSFVTWPFFKVNPNTLDNIFAVKADSTWESDQFLVNSYIGCKVVRPLSRDGVPY
jgi:hypothetical protein